MIRIENLTHFFDDNSMILNNISFSIKKGEFVALTGPSGIGKSTIANIIAGFVKPMEGRVFISDNDVTGSPSKKVILLNQESDLFPWQNVDNHLLFVLKDKNKKDKHSIKKELLNLVKLEGSEKKYPHQLSGGMKKRLSLARAMAANPELIILDETFTSLDSNLKRSLYTELKRIWESKETTILIITHDSSDIKSLVQKNVVLTEERPAQIKEIVYLN